MLHDAVVHVAPQLVTGEISTPMGDALPGGCPGISFNRFVPMKSFFPQIRSLLVIIGHRRASKETGLQQKADDLEFDLAIDGWI